MGLGGPPFGAPAMPPPAPPWAPFRGDGSNAHQVVDTMLGASQPLTLEDAFGAVFTKLSKDTGNADLIGELEGLRGRIAERLAGQRAARQSDLENRHDAVYEQCRSALDRKTALVNRAGALESQAHAAVEELSRYRVAMASVEGRRPPDETFPTRQELQAHQAEVAEARGRLDRVQRQYDDLVATAGEVDRDVHAADRELDRLMAEELRLKAQIEGKPWRTPLGLEVRPEAE
jgi:hypothetical protein